MKVTAEKFMTLNKIFIRYESSRRPLHKSSDISPKNAIKAAITEKRIENII